MRRVAYEWGAAVVAATILATSVVFTPDTLPALQTCAFHALTGFECPGCGLTRAFCAIGQADFAAAWGFNPLAFVLFPFVVSLLLWPFATRLMPRLRGWSEHGKVLVYGAPIIVAIAWLHGALRAVR